MNSRTFKSLATAVAGGLLLVGTGVPAQAAAASSTLGKLPTAVTAATGGGSVSVPVTYKCTNNTKTTHYVTAMLNQPGPWDWDLAYVAGFRGDTGGMVKAKCTGKTVKHVLKLKEGAYSNFEATLTKGAGTLSVDLERRGAGSAGAYKLASSLTKTTAVTVR